MLPESSSVNSRLGSTEEPLAEASGTFEISVTAAEAPPAISAQPIAWRIACFAEEGLSTMLSLMPAVFLLAANHRLHDGDRTARSLRAHGDPVVVGRRAGEEVGAALVDAFAAHHGAVFGRGARRGGRFCGAEV